MASKRLGGWLDRLALLAAGTDNAATDDCGTASELSKWRWVERWHQQNQQPAKASNSNQQTKQNRHTHIMSTSHTTTKLASVDEITNAQ